ncbi:hypothetical protein I6F35_35515 [Bradyrhizobium sp. BRP22]|uniref:hypothetical protein n=1 Tax=Bradyrhizobium sp. BRP22 TaxID=2793821 RepID=UPI001CD1DA77|nr:hypothetical protein [Bradyrhizobium sp. BRP22]MCA1458422.1 hypothetical protein [Bradyrhizobium sp. BRP22]
MSRSNSACYRAKAEDCRARAERAKSRIEKECWQFFADEWQKLAEDTERLEKPMSLRSMPHLETCLGILRRLIAKGNLNGVPLAERAINEYWDATLPRARKSGLRLLRQDILAQANAVVGDRRSFAEIVNAYIETKLAE